MCSILTTRDVQVMEALAPAVIFAAAVIEPYFTKQCHALHPWEPYWWKSCCRGYWTALKHCAAVQYFCQCSAHSCQSWTLHIALQCYFALAPYKYSSIAHADMFSTSKSLSLLVATAVPKQCNRLPLKLIYKSPALEGGVPPALCNCPITCNVQQTDTICT